jgi:hypothetical protein
MTKQQYLVVHDYGMGGVWGVMAARSGEEIRRKYPQLEVLEVRPDWMSEADYHDILSNSSFDIDAEPRGWLAKLGET